VIYLNEEKYLLRLLTSIKKQDFPNCELIVADAGSTDGTVQIAQEYHARVVPGGLPGIGRNNGAKAAKGDFLLFLDADVVIPDNFLHDAINEIETEFYELATCVMVPLSRLKIDQNIYKAFNLALKMSKDFNPMAPGSCIFISRRLFERIGGFDETITLAEDFNLSKRAAHFRPLNVLKSTYIRLSVRRLRKEGRTAFVYKALLTAFYRSFHGEVRKNVIPYEFGNYSIRYNDKVAKRFRKIDGVIIGADLLSKRFNHYLAMKWDSHHHKFIG